MLQLLPTLIQVGKSLMTAGKAAGAAAGTSGGLKSLLNLGNIANATGLAAQTVKDIDDYEASIMPGQSRRIPTVRQGSLQNLLRDYYG
jgi:hypothetical protein